jgi:hypothetical protein
MRAEYLFNFAPTAGAANTRCDADAEADVAGVSADVAGVLMKRISGQKLCWVTKEVFRRRLKSRCFDRDHSHFIDFDEALNHLHFSRHSQVSRVFGSHFDA